MREAILYSKETDNIVRCRVCPHLCRIKPGHEGYCGVRGNRDGKLYDLVYGLCSSIAVDPIEKKPVFHFHPGSKVLSFGTIGCNLRCAHCQNWQIAYAKPEETTRLQECDPTKAAELAREYNCEGVAWTYNEPTIWIEHTIDAAKACRESGIYTVYVTNGYITEEALDAIAPYLDVYRVDLKGFSDDAYRQLASIRSFKPILEAADRAKNHWHLHVEVVTNLIPGLNDDAESLKQLSGWIKSTLGEETPWHVTRFYPYLKLSHLEPTPISSLENAREIGVTSGLKYVYIGNAPGHEGENTYCPNCGALVIERTGYADRFVEYDDGCCASCKASLDIISRPGPK